MNIFEKYFDFISVETTVVMMIAGWLMLMTSWMLGKEKNKK